MGFGVLSQITEMEFKSIFGAAFVLVVMKLVFDFITRLQLINRMAKLESAVERVVTAITTLILKGGSK